MKNNEEVANVYLTQTSYYSLLSCLSDYVMIFIERQKSKLSI